MLQKLKIEDYSDTIRSKICFSKRSTTKMTACACSTNWVVIIYFLTFSAWIKFRYSRMKFIDFIFHFVIGKSIFCILLIFSTNFKWIHSFSEVILDFTEFLWFRFNKSIILSVKSGWLRHSSSRRVIYFIVLIFFLFFNYWWLST